MPATVVRLPSVIPRKRGGRRNRSGRRCRSPSDPSVRVRVRQTTFEQLTSVKDSLSLRTMNSGVHAYSVSLRKLQVSNDSFKYSRTVWTTGLSLSVQKTE